ncbi:somatostatin receptor type 5-like [Eriocheir sinensis]|uniref:somatostatin receptor type 5-like n=1 Tax=Eriocheir sinensis TaxID=95602 RepID=UPI0021CA2478|nr:somatostatin receptor type 5-like [Eriocheir sinensis]
MGNFTKPWEWEYESYFGNFTLPEPWEWPSEDYRNWVVKNVLNGLATAFGLLANGLLLGLLSRAPPLRTVSNMFLLQRAVADVLVLMVVPFIIYANIHHYYDEFSPPMCTALSIVVHGAMMASHMFLMLFTVDSYLASRPQRHTLARRRKVLRVTSAAAWLLAPVSGAAAFFIFIRPVSAHCYFHQASLAFQMHDFVFRLGVPLVVVWVFVAMTRCCRPAEPSSQDKPEGGEGAPSRQLLLGLAASFTVILVFIWIGVFQGYRLLFIDSMIPVIAFTLPYLEKVVNPILVICLSEGLRQSVAGRLPVRRSASLPLQEL